MSNIPMNCFLSECIEKCGPFGRTVYPQPGRGSCLVAMPDNPTYAGGKVNILKHDISMCHVVPCVVQKAKLRSNFSTRCIMDATLFYMNSIIQSILNS